jgi:hypothetical protein
VTKKRPKVDLCAFDPLRKPSDHGVLSLSPSPGVLPHPTRC